MFDFGFSELVVVCVVALVVLGPTRLPGLVRKVGRWVGKARAMARDFREQLENEVDVAELNRTIQKEVMGQPAPPPEAQAAAAAGEGPAQADAAVPADATTAHDGPTDGAQALADSGYPYGVPTNTSSTSADPAVTAHELQPEDDAYSHAHAPGEAPQPWDPEPEPQPDAGASPADPAPDARRDA